MPKHPPAFWLHGLGVLSAAATLAACGTLPSTAPTPLKAAVGAPLQNCAALATQFRFDQTAGHLSHPGARRRTEARRKRGSGALSGERRDEATQGQRRT